MPCKKKCDAKNLMPSKLKGDTKDFAMLYF